MKIVLDTNVLVSALLTPRGPAAQILDLIAQQKVTLLFDERILEEYREVLQRPKFGFEGTLTGELILFLETLGEFVHATPLWVSLPDSSDQMFAEVAKDGAADALITGNLRHFPARLCRGLKVLSPAQFLIFWKNQQKIL